MRFLNIPRGEPKGAPVRLFHVYRKVRKLSKILIWVVLNPLAGDFRMRIAVRCSGNNRNAAL